MNLYPAVDPIPLPAPVWLFKGLHLLTTSLHFVAVAVLIGGLLASLLLNLFGGTGRGSARSALRLGAAAALARRLPVVMTYVINLGVPPLLFSQVLYGRQLYTSSVLIGLWWIAVIPLLILGYWLLYRYSERTERGAGAWWVGALSFLIIAGIARIYSTNFALLVRPDAWRDLYASSASGASLLISDPTLLPRWSVMMSAGLWAGGLWMLWISTRRSTVPALGSYLAVVGGRFITGGILLHVAAVWWLHGNLSPAVTKGLGESVLYMGAGVVWALGALIVLALGVLALLRHATGALVAYSSALAALLTLAGWAVLRDGIRDLTLGERSFDVWNRSIVTNWGVVAIFLVVFVAGLGALAWLISVVARAKTQMEGPQS